MSRDLARRIGAIEKALKGQNGGWLDLSRLTDQELDLLILCYTEDGLWTGGVGKITEAEAEIVCDALRKITLDFPDFRALKVPASECLCMREHV